MNSGPQGGALATQGRALSPLLPRLLDLEGAALYLSVSTWTVRDLIGNGTLRRVLIPLAGHRDLRKILLDREDLDQLVARWKEAGP